MPAFTPLATTNEKQPVDMAALWDDDDTDSMNDDEPQNKKMITRIFNKGFAQYLKLGVLFTIAFVHLIYLNDFLVKFAAVDQMTKDIMHMTPDSQKMADDMNAIQYSFHGYVDYKKNLWMIVGAMSACLASTAALLMIDTGNHLPYGRLTMSALRIFDFVVFHLIGLFLIARISAALIIAHTTQHALRSAARLSNTIITELVDTLSCSIEQRDDDIPMCSTVIIRSIFPVKVIEYLVILCILTGAYIGLAYLIQWCIRHFFPPTREHMSPIRAISRNLIHSSGYTHRADEKILVAA